MKAEKILKDFEFGEKFYDDGVIESEILALESLLIKSLNKQQAEIYQKIKDKKILLERNLKLELIEFILQK